MQITHLKLLILALAVAVLLAVPRAAAGDQPVAKAYLPPMVVPAAAFLNNGQDPEDFVFRNGGVEGLGTPVEMVAPVYLPDDATVTGFRAYIYDNSATCGFNREDVDIFLVRTSLVDGVAQSVAITASSGGNDSVDFEPTHTLNASRAVINNGSYEYWIHMRICSFSHRVNAVVIEY